MWAAVSETRPDAHRPRTTRRRSILRRAGGCRAAAWCRTRAPRSTFEWTDGASENCAHNCVELRGSKYRVPTMLDGPVVDTHIFAFESCAA